MKLVLCLAALLLSGCGITAKMASQVKVVNGILQASSLSKDIEGDFFFITNNGPTTVEVRAGDLKYSPVTDQWTYKWIHLKISGGTEIKLGVVPDDTK